MKTFFVYTFLLFALSNCEHNNVKHSNVEHDSVALSEYIELRHTGIQDKPINPLIISTKKVRFEVDRSDVAFLDPKKPLTPEIKEAYLNMNYDFIITDPMTYQSIVSFVDENQFFFINGTNTNYIGYEGYSITMNGRTYEIPYELKTRFFGELQGYLQMKNGDKRLITKLAEY